MIISFTVYVQVVNVNNSFVLDSVFLSYCPLIILEFGHLVVFFNKVRLSIRKVFGVRKGIRP